MWQGRGPNVTVACNDHDSDTYHSVDDHVHRPLDFLDDSQCISFRATKGCNPDGDREPENDRPCREQIEQYVNERTGADFTHSICPSCLDEQVRPQMEAYKKSMHSGTVAGSNG